MRKSRPERRLFLFPKKAKRGQVVDLKLRKPESLRVNTGKARILPVSKWKNPFLMLAKARIPKKSQAALQRILIRQSQRIMDSWSSRDPAGNPKANAAKLASTIRVAIWQESSRVLGNAEAFLPSEREIFGKIIEYARKFPKDEIVISEELLSKINALNSEFEKLLAQKR